MKVLVDFRDGMGHQVRGLNGLPYHVSKYRKCPESPALREFISGSGIRQRKGESLCDFVGRFSGSLARKRNSLVTAVHRAKRLGGHGRPNKGVLCFSVSSGGRVDLVFGDWLEFTQSLSL